jgi:hypothetical protein
LKGGVGFTGASGHDEQDAVHAVGDGFNGGVDGVALVVARGFASGVFKVILEHDRLSLGGDAFPGPVAGPETGGGWEAFQGEGGFLLRAGPSAVVEHEAVAIAGEDEWDIEGGGGFEGLLDAVANTVVVVLGLDDGQRDVGLVIEYVVGALGFATGDQPAANNDTALGEADLFADLGEFVPAGLLQGRGNELGADVALAEGFFVHGAGLRRGRLSRVW